VETTTTTTPMTLFRKTGKHLTLTIMNQFYSRAAICKLNVRDGSRKCGTVKNAGMENAGPPSISRKRGVSKIVVIIVKMITLTRTTQVSHT